MEISILPLPTSLVQRLDSCLLLQASFTENSHRDELFAPPPFFSVLRAPRPLCCMSFLVPFLLFRFFFFFLWGGGQSVQGAMLVYTWGSCVNTMCHLFAYLLVCVSQAGLDPVSGSTGFLLFSQCNMAWRSFVWVGGSGVRVLLLLCDCFFCQMWLQHLSKFLIYGAHSTSSHHLRFLLQYTFN
jgi:hypothetical protein